MLPNNRKPYSRKTTAAKKSTASSEQSVSSAASAKTGTRRKKKMPWYKKLLWMMIPTKKDSTNDKIRKIIFDVAIVVFICSSITALRTCWAPPRRRVRSLRAMCMAS